MRGFVIEEEEVPLARGGVRLSPPLDTVGGLIGLSVVAVVGHSEENLAVGDVEIREYDPGWPEAFRDVAGRLRAALGDIAVRIDHVGSTSIPGLASKDVIDVQVSVADETALGLADSSLEAGGWRRSPGIGSDHPVVGASSDERDWRKVVFTEPPGHRRVNLHVRVQGRPNQRYALLFRDYLRAHPASAGAYETLKRHLAALLPRDSDRYADVKDAGCDLIYFAAEEWAQAVGWTCEP
jgi:GrpB-like predicted nucleotidyltransferase (UPF0157 family)